MIAGTGYINRVMLSLILSLIFLTDNIWEVSLF